MGCKKQCRDFFVVIQKEKRQPGLAEKKYVPDPEKR
jgi:hypothetical protein